MARCFLSYSFEYRHIMEAIRGIIKALEFEGVDVFDEPDGAHPPAEIVQQRIKAADCVVVLYGPAKRPLTPGDSCEPARWPYEEALLAHGRDKPITLIIHAGTVLPSTLQSYQTPARFDFWDPKSFQENVHHVVKHLVEFRRRIDLPENTRQPFLYKKVEVHHRIGRGGFQQEDWYHEVIAAKSRDLFHHALGTGTDEAADAVRRCIEEGAFEVEAGVGSDWHQVRLEPVAYNAQQFEYLIRITPPLRPGEVFGYRRSFDLPNRFPLTPEEVRSKLAGNARVDPKFPTRLFEGKYYGEYLNVVYDVETVRYSFHFPRRMKIASYKAVVVELLKRDVENKEESERCNSKANLRLIEDPASPERVLELTVHRPLFNHSYYILYEPADIDAI